MNNFIKAIKTIKTEDTVHRKSGVGKVKASNEVTKEKILHMLKLWQYYHKKKKKKRKEARGRSKV